MKNLSRIIFVVFVGKSLVGVHLHEIDAGLYQFSASLSQARHNGPRRDLVCP